MSDFKDYIEHGWLLVPIAPGQKGPAGAASKGWNQREKCITDPSTKLRGAGLAHAYSGTCAIDVDNYPVAAAWLAERGVDLDELFAAPDAVQISSGRAAHGKLLYALPEPLNSQTVVYDENKKAALNFRCASAAGRTVQDVLPPSIHPDTGNPYRWVYDDLITDWRSLPMIPQVLHDIWLGELVASADLTVVPDKGAGADELRALLEHHNPDMSREEWVRVGMAIHHETDGSAEGLGIWDEWSQASNKYAGTADLQNCWRSFHDTPNAVTVGHLRQGTIATAEEFPHVDESAPAVDPWAQVEKQKRERFKLIHVGEIAEREPPEWLVEGAIPKADLAMMYGAPGSGKSFVALDLAFSVATGFTWFNMKTHKGPVVWIAAEAAYAMRNRARAYGQARGVVLDNTDLWVIEQTLSLMSSEDADALMHVMAETKPVLIVVDTLVAASGGADENSGADMNKVMDNCRRLHESTGALVMLIHHSGKDAARGARGWSGLHGAVRAEFLLTHREGSPIRVMETTKQSEGVEGEQYPFKLQPVPIDFDEDTTSCVVEPLDASVLDGDSLSEKLGPTQKLVFQAVTDLVAEYLDEDNAIPIQQVYDVAIDTMPRPSDGIRDRRPETIRRALAALCEKGYVAITEDQVTIGSVIDEKVNESPLSKV